MSKRNTTKFEELIREMAGKFFVEEANSINSLITVTKVESSPDRKNATIFFTVFPEMKEKPAVDFAKRKRSEFKEYLKDNSRLPQIPFVDFEIDLGEKNRQNIDKISEMM